MLVTTNKMGRHLVPDIHLHKQLKNVYVFVCSERNNDQDVKWTTKHNKVTLYQIRVLTVIEFLSRSNVYVLISIN